MKEIKLETTITIFSSSAELASEDQELLEAARDAVEHSYSPYSKFQVGAAVRLKNGVIISGSNQENAAYPICLCAERVALAAAASQYPKVSVTSIAVTVKNAGKRVTRPAGPCGACRQALAEWEQRFQQKIKVILQGEGGDVYLISAAGDLLPLSFDYTFLGR